MEHDFTLKNPMPPEWLMYPHIPNGSIGWRMGYGENYSCELHKWKTTLTDEEKKLYSKMFPVPKPWLRTYVNKQITFWHYKGNPEYSINELISDYNSDRHLEFIFFWGNTSTKKGLDKACLSQWWKSDFQVGIYKYCCMEQYMMAEKAKLFNDIEIEKKILEETEPEKIKNLGRCVKNFDEDIWNNYKYSIVLNGNYYKFIQNKDLLNYLISTQDKILVEASPYDGVWGIKMSANDKNICNPTMWSGENLLGFALMEVRNELIKVCSNNLKVDWELLSELFD